MSRSGILTKLLVSIILLLFPLTLFSQDVIEKIVVTGNVRIPRQTILHHVFVKEGKPFNKDELPKDFEALWSTGFFSDIKIEEEKGQKGIVLKIIVQENPFIRNVTFKTGNKLKKKAVMEWLKENGRYISPYSFCSPYELDRTKNSIQELLLEKGFSSGKVKVSISDTKNNSQDIVFLVEEGEKARVGEIMFVGETGISENILRSSIKENQEHSIESWITRRDIFRENRLDEDLASVKQTLQDRGFMNATIGKPRIEDFFKRGINLKTQRMKKIFIPVQAGERYEVGNVQVEGNEVLSIETLENAIRLKQGQVYTLKDRERSIEEMTRLYLQKGYLYVRITPVETFDHDQKRIDVRFRISEGEVTYLHRLEFKGNSFVKDKVMRKKILVRERDRFNFQLFEESLLRISQLGIVKVEKEPELKPDPDDPTNIDVFVYVKERLKSDYHISGGYNGYGGIYLAADYATINLLGAGEILHFTFESGRKIKDYMFDLSEPYLLDYPINFGLNVYYRDNILPDLFNRRSIGANIITGVLIKGYWRANLTYGYENVNIKLPDEQREGESDFDPIFTTIFGLGNYDFSSAILSVFHTNLETPSFPYRKNLFSASCKFAGSFLGGDISIVKSRFAWSFFHSLFGEHAAGFYVDYQHIEALGDSPIPFWERFFLGGERSIRGYDVYSIGPRSEEGTNIGGKKALVFNAEYIMPVFGPLYAVLFYDMGNAHSLEQRVHLKDMYSSTGLELRIFYEKLPLPVRVIFSYNNRKIDPDDSHFTFRFTVGTYF